jgi:hypothetical protein
MGVAAVVLLAFFFVPAVPLTMHMGLVGYEKTLNVYHSLGCATLHMVERGDLQIVALAAAHAKKGDGVELIFRDRALKDCLESVLSRQGIRGVTITDSSLLVQRLPRR